MELEKQIEILKEWRKGAEMSLPIMSSADIERFLHWLEDYKQLKADYIELDKQLRTANTEIDRLRSENSWISVQRRMPFEPGVHVLVTDGIHIMESWYEVIDGEMLWVDNYTMYVNINFGEVTHWMPIPELPKGESK